CCVPRARIREGLRELRLEHMDAHVRDLHRLSPWPDRRAQPDGGRPAGLPARCTCPNIAPAITRRRGREGRMAQQRLALDIGGTFTDVVMAQASGELWIAKTPSTPADPSRGFFDGVERIFRLAGATPESVAAVFHGSTIATNTVLERKGAKTGMLVTAG